MQAALRARMRAKYSTKAMLMPLSGRFVREIPLSGHVYVYRDTILKLHRVHGATKGANRARE